MSKIEKINAQEILDSRGNPTIMVNLTLNNGIIATACVPSGASTGMREAVELRDGDAKRYGGKGVLKAVENVNKIIAPKLKGKSPQAQKEIDDLMCKLDGTENKSKLGANAILGVSMAVCRAAALDSDTPLYAYIRKPFLSCTSPSTRLKPGVNERRAKFVLVCAIRDYESAPAVSRP